MRNSRHHTAISEESLPRGLTARLAFKKSKCPNCQSFQEGSFKLNGHRELKLASLTNAFSILTLPVQHCVQKMWTTRDQPKETNKSQSPAMSLIQIKVTAYLQRCLQSNACSASQFRRKYPKCYIKLKLIILAVSCH